MANVMSRRGVLAAALGGIASLGLPSRAEERPTATINLKSGYSGKWLVAGARRVSLSVTLGASGNGSGTLTLDPNIYDRGTATQIAIHQIDVRVELIHDDDQSAKGRRLYELKKTGLDGKVEAGDEHWFLVKPIKEGMPCWLLFVDKDGKFEEALILE
jgi:hypothetical protein